MTEAEANRLIEAENARRDTAGIVFLAGMMLAGALTVVGALAFADAPANTGTTTEAQVSAH